MKMGILGLMVVLGGSLVANESAAESMVAELGVRVMANTLTTTELERADSAAVEAVYRLDDSQLQFLLNSQRLFYCGFFHLGRGNDRQAESCFEQAASAAARANKIEATSAGLRLRSDALQQLLEIRGTLYQMLNWRTARDAALEAVALDPGNPSAHLSAASYLTTAPALGGGDLDRARHHVSRASELVAALPPEDSQLLQFLVAVWEARLAAKAGDARGTDAALARATSIYPQNWWLADAREKTRADLRNR
jgi:tetratricopeptide (TPR) repeat protein